jgi:hypothetical protein
MTTIYEKKLQEKAQEFKNAGMSIIGIEDSLYQFHREQFLFGETSMNEQIEFNKSIGLPQYARPEKSLWKICEIVEAVNEE